MHANFISGRRCEQPIHIFNRWINQKLDEEDKKIKRLLLLHRSDKSGHCVLLHLVQSWKAGRSLDLSDDEKDEGESDEEVFGT